MAATATTLTVSTAVAMARRGARVTGIGEALFKARIIRQLTHKALAERMDLAKQQIQRYEATRHAGVSIERLQQVADARNLRVNEVFALEKE